MKIKLLFFLTAFLLYCVVSFGQCNICTDPNNTITNNGDGTFTAANAQEYFWEICDGSASIRGSNTNQTVSVNANTNYRIKLVRFNSGNCFESCEIINNPCLSSPNCPSRVTVQGNAGICEDGFASIGGIDSQCVDHVDWRVEIHSPAFTRTYTSPSTQLAFTISPAPPNIGTWNGFNVVVYAKVTFLNGTICPEISGFSTLSGCEPIIGNPRIDNNRESVTEGKE